jgi:hypothetical protein
MDQLLLVLLLVVVLALGIVRLFRLPIHWTGYTALALIVVAVYLYSLLDARAKPWSLWRQSWMQDSGDPEQRRLARYTTQDECLTAQWKKLDEEVQQQRQVHEAMKSIRVGSPKVLLQEGRTIFQLGPSFWSRMPGSRTRALADPGEKKNLTAHQQERLAYEMGLPEIVSTVSVYCAPSAQYSLWPFYTPTYQAAADDLRRLGERTLADRAKQMLGE